VGDEGEHDAFGPWNQGGDWKIVEAPELEQGVENLNGGSAEKIAGNKRQGHKETPKTKAQKTA
jgi:hypothetical protein